MSAATADYVTDANYVFVDRGTSTVVVLLHGLGGDVNQPLGLTPDRLASTGRSVLVPDARAHGRTMVIGPSERFTTAALTDDVLALMDHLGLGEKHVVWIGISMGAAVALQAARERAENTVGAMLIRPSFVDRPWPAHLLVFREIADLLRTRGAAEGADAFRRTRTFQEVQATSPSAAASLVEQFSKPHAQERVVRLETVPGNVAVDWEGAVKLSCPVTVVAAAEDPGHPTYVAELWSERIESSRLIYLPSRDQDPHEYASRLAETVTSGAQGRS